MVAPALGPAAPTPVAKDERDDDSRVVGFDYLQQGLGADNHYRVRFRGVITYTRGRDYDVTSTQTKAWVQQFHNCLNVTNRYHTAMRFNLAALNEGFNPDNHQIDVFGPVNSWGASNNPADNSGPRHNLSQGTAQRVGCLRLALELWQRMFQVNANTQPPMTYKGKMRKTSIVKLGVFQSFLPVELADKAYSSMTKVMVKIMNNEI